MESIIKELWHGNIVPQEDSRTNSPQMKEFNVYGTKKMRGVFTRGEDFSP